MTSPLTRRTVLAGGAAAGAALVVGCSAGAGSSPAPAAGASDAGAGAGASGPPEPLAALADLPMGTAVAAELDGNPVLLVRTSETAVSAYSAVCPHSGCTVGAGAGPLVCPCHGSSFGLDGALVNGPARRGLAKVTVSVVDGQVLPA